MLAARWCSHSTFCTSRFQHSGAVPGLCYLRSAYSSSRRVLHRCRAPALREIEATAMTQSTTYQSAASLDAALRDEPQGMESEARLLTVLTEIPTISKAWCYPGTGSNVQVTIQRTQRNLPANKQRAYLSSFTLNKGLTAVGGSFPVELKDVQLLSLSPSGKRHFIVRAGSDSASALLEIWGGGRLLKELSVPKSVHGPVYNDGWFGVGAAWSPDERRIAYVAEAPPSARTPEWGASASSQSSAQVDSNGAKPAAKEQAGPKGWRGVGEWQEDWGELNTGKSPPALFVLDTKAWAVSRVQGVPADVSAGQPTWAPSGDMLVFTAWPHSARNMPSMPQRLGIVYCMNRPRLVFHSHEASCQTGVHCGTAALYALSWQTGDSQAAARQAASSGADCIVDVVHSVANDRTKFPGLYATAVAPYPFVGPEELLITTQWGSKTHIVKVDVGAKTVQRVTPDDAGSWTYLSASQGVVLASTSAPNAPSALMAASPSGAAADGPWQWQKLEACEREPLEAGAEDALRQVQWEIIQVAPTTPPADLNFETIILRSSVQPGPRPTILAPHGGPHSAYPAAFFLPYAFLVALGYNILLVNFRGSTGQGEGSICSLPGKAGENDVADCIAALDAGVKAGYVDPGRVALVGGSHGGFLTGHLCGQHPDRFKCAVLRNPVCDLTLMIHVSDIPDWIYVEAYGVKEGIKRMRARPSAEDLARFLEVSPVAHARNVKAPMFFMLGAKDRRVPMIDAKQYINALRSRPDGPETRTIVFPEDWHGLDKPQTEFEQWLNVAWWLKRHMGADQ
ncbi:hypothetical protein WJX72_008476 [[Myrmecia] bisecta]|uniref:acylaminoacyl-peptidase n=1 Tax=[Myrmecia] bisecta TaxID=41462 RepID=A0AAW1NZD3_9CHLO